MNKCCTLYFVCKDFNNASQHTCEQSDIGHKTPHKKFTDVQCPDKKTHEHRRKNVRTRLLMAEVKLLCKLEDNLCDLTENMIDETDATPNLSNDLQSLTNDRFNKIERSVDQLITKKLMKNVK